MNNHIEECPLNEVQRTFATFRIVHPGAEKAMQRSLSLYGQISPLICAATPAGLELIDGFKRVRAAEAMSWQTVKVRRLPTTIRACKAGIIQFNRGARSISDLEEAMVLRSLHREDSLSQAELAMLLGRDKSWVCRRIALVERLIDEVWQHIGVGLIPVSVGRELARLPRGNQATTLAAVVKYRLGKRQTETLVRLLLTKPSWNHDAILLHARELCEEDRVEPPITSRGFYHRLAHLAQRQSQAIAGATHDCYPENERQEALLQELIVSSRTLVSKLQALLSDSPEEAF